MSLTTIVFVWVGAQMGILFALAAFIDVDDVDSDESLELPKHWRIPVVGALLFIFPQVLAVLAGHKVHKWRKAPGKVFNALRKSK